MAKNLPSVQETWVPSLGQECLPEKEMATHSNIIAQRTLWDGKSHRQRNLVGCSPWGCKELDVTEQLILLLSQNYYQRKILSDPVAW